MPESLSSSTHTHFPVDDFGSGCSGTGTIGPPLALRGSAGDGGKGAVEEGTGRGDDGVGGRAGGSIFVILF